jgi:hypothetical protein
MSTPTTDELTARKEIGRREMSPVPPGGALLESFPPL